MGACSWVPAPLCYQWYAGGTKIKKATTSTLTLTSKQKNKKITVKKTGYKTSKATAQGKAFIPDGLA